jgi:hypothetical protein
VGEQRIRGVILSTSCFRRRTLPVVAGIAALLGTAAPTMAASVEFREVSPGISYAPLAQDDVAGHAFDVDLGRAAVRLLTAGPPGTRAPVASLAAPHPVHVAVNASFFDDQGHTLGRAIADGERVGGPVNRRWGVLAIANGAVQVLPGDEAPTGGTVVVQGIPRLVVEGSVPGLKPQVARRTAACAAGSHLTLVVITTQVEAGAFARFLARPRAEGGLGCTNALNLDGGSSTQLSVELPGLSIGVDGAWGVPNALVVTPATAVAAPRATP